MARKAQSALWLSAAPPAVKPVGKIGDPPSQPGAPPILPDEIGGVVTGTGRTAATQETDHGPRSPRLNDGTGEGPGGRAIGGIGLQGQDDGGVPGQISHPAGQPPAAYQHPRPGRGPDRPGSLRSFREDEDTSGRISVPGREERRERPDGTKGEFREGGIALNAVLREENALHGPDGAIAIAAEHQDGLTLSEGQERTTRAARQRPRRQAQHSSAWGQIETTGFHPIAQRPSGKGFRNGENSTEFCGNRRGGGNQRVPVPG